MSAALAFAVSAALTFAAPGRSSDGPADEAYRRGSALFEGARHAEAAAEFEEAYLLDANPDYLYAAALNHAMSGHCEKALLLWERFLDLGPPASDVADAHEMIDQCRGLLGLPPRPASPDVAAPELVPEPPPPTHAPQRAAPHSDIPAAARLPWHRDVAGGVLVGLGAALLVTGGAVGITGRVTASRADDATNDGDFLERLERGRTLNWVGIGLAAAGAVLAVAGAVRYGVVARRLRE